jgi:hypothetical protein
MEREHWAELTAAIRAVARTWKGDARCQHPLHRIVSVYCWAALHDRSICWATQDSNWPTSLRPHPLPDQSTVSRRTRRPDFQRFLQAVGEQLASEAQPQKVLSLLCLDGKPLPVAAHSTDTHASFGRGAGQKARGYKLHAIWGCGPMPLQWLVAPLNVCEKPMARRLLRRLAKRGQISGGYLLADGYFDWSELFDEAAQANLPLLCPRQYPGTALGHHYQSPHRKRSIQMLESPCALNEFGPVLYAQRKQIERQFGNLSSFGGGLTCLPGWVRRIWRVRNWVHAKLLINACRIRCLRRRQQAAA